MKPVSVQSLHTLTRQRQYKLTDQKMPNKDQILRQVRLPQSTTVLHGRSKVFRQINRKRFVCKNVHFTKNAFTYIFCHRFVSNSTSTKTFDFSPCGISIKQTVIPATKSGKIQLSWQFRIQLKNGINFNGGYPFQHFWPKLSLFGSGCQLV